MTAEEITSALSTRVVGREVVVRERVTSTNDVAASLARAGAQEGLAVVALEQTAGRGRFGRRWYSPRGEGLWMSVVLRPAGGAGLLPVLGALALARGCERFVPRRLGVKWPNDVVVEGRKLGGVLVEPVPGAWIVGVGCNISLDPLALPPEVTRSAVCLASLGVEVSVAELAAAVLSEMDGLYPPGPGLVQEWRRRSSLLGERVRLAAGSRVVEGVAVDIDGSGALVIREDSGVLSQHLGGEVTVLKSR